MSDQGALVPLRRTPARRSRRPLALARRALHDPRTSAVVAAAVALGAERGLRRLTAGTTRLPIGRRSRGRAVDAVDAVDAGIHVEWVSYVVRLTGRAPLPR